MQHMQKGGIVNDHKARQLATSIITAIDGKVNAWEKALEDDPEALLGPTVSDLLNALRGWDVEAAESRSWMLSV